MAFCILKVALASGPQSRRRSRESACEGWLAITGEREPEVDGLYRRHPRRSIGIVNPDGSRSRISRSGRNDLVHQTCSSCSASYASRALRRSLMQCQSCVNMLTTSRAASASLFATSLMLASPSTYPVSPPCPAQVDFSASYSRTTRTADDRRPRRATECRIDQYKECHQP